MILLKINIEMAVLIILAICVILPLMWVIISSTIENKKREQYRNLSNMIKEEIGINSWAYAIEQDDVVMLKSSKAVDNYDYEKYLRERRDQLQNILDRLDRKERYAQKLQSFLKSDSILKDEPQYDVIEKEMKHNVNMCRQFYIKVIYLSPAGRSCNQRLLLLDKQKLQYYIDNPELLMTKTEYNQFAKQQNKEMVENKQYDYYQKVNKIIDIANEYRDKLIIKDDRTKLDQLVLLLYEKTVNHIKKIKVLDSEEWGVIDKIITTIDDDIENILDENKKILDYYESDDFCHIKDLCGSMMESQKEFNAYIDEKVKSISDLFGKKITRNETEIDDIYNYVRRYKKSITPFTAEVSASVFASAENNPMEYLVKYFYPDKNIYPEQIQKLQFLIEELETLKDAKEIIDNYKKEYQKYITDVPSFVMDNDEDGFYSRLGFANISENMLTVEYMFCYTSGGGMAKRSFTIPMNEDNIINLINKLQSKLTMSAFAKEQRSLMTGKLRLFIMERDDYTCKYCNNSTKKEPNLLLEIDHIIPVSKGGCTVEDNLQTLCWRCNRKKSNKLV